MITGPHCPCAQRVCPFVVRGTASGVSLRHVFGALMHANTQSCYTAVMSKEQLRALRTLAANVRKYTPRIEKKLRKAGIKPDPALVFTAAMYYPALNRLANT